MTVTAYTLLRRHATLDTPYFFWRCHSPGSKVDAAIDAAEKWISK